MKELPKDSHGWHPRMAGGFDGFNEFMRARGGIVRRSDFLVAGWTADELRIAYGFYGRPERLRRGWYCVPELPDDVRRAWKAGGPLACVSAIQWHTGASVAGPLHISMRRQTHRRRDERHSRSERQPVIHWDDLPPDSDNAWAVPLNLAREQARHCLYLSRG